MPSAYYLAFANCDAEFRFELIAHQGHHAHAAPMPAFVVCWVVQQNKSVHFIRVVNIGATFAPYLRLADFLPFVPTLLDDAPLAMARVTIRFWLRPDRFTPCTFHFLFPLGLPAPSLEALTD